VSYVVSQGAHDLPGAAGIVAVLVLAVAGGVAFARIAAADLSGAGTERIVSAVAV
jgi:hypothetical protein